MYSFYASLIGCNIITAEKSGDGGIDFDELRSLIRQNRCKAVIFSNPCNPTGRAYDRETITGFIRSVDCVVIVDEAYMEFCRDGCSVLDMCGVYDNLVVLKTLSKAYGGAGLRIGFSVSEPDIASALRKLKSPYNLNSVSQLFGRILLEHYTSTAALAKKIAADTQKLRTSLAEFAGRAGCNPLATDANFIMLAFDNDITADIIYRHLKENNIIIPVPTAATAITCVPNMKRTADDEFDNITKVY